MEETDPKELVRKGYDRVSFAYRADDCDVDSSEYATWLASLDPILEERTPVMDLGCGCGLPVSRLLARKYSVTGIDISPVQIARARKLVPKAHFSCADATAVDYPSGSFAAIVSFYTIIHIPLAEQLPLLHRIAGWLRPGGYLLMTAGHAAWTGTEEDWLDVEGGRMYWSHTDAVTYRRWLALLGFSLLQEQFIPEGNGGHSLFFACRNKLPFLP